MDRTNPSKDIRLGTSSKRWLTVIFFLSGYSALSYEVIWQRSLFGIYGLNVESVTIVVTAFMVGLGLGSLVGGLLSESKRWSPVTLFAGCEYTIGAYGALSLALMERVGNGTMTWPDSLVFLVSFLLVLVPTLAMGATLPLLAKHFVAAEGNVGRAVSRLYFVNTLGSALAALLSASVVLGSLGLQKTVWLAAFTNFLVGSLALVHDRSHRMPSTAGQEGSP